MITFSQNATTLNAELLQRGYTYSESIQERRYKQYLSPNGRLLLIKDAYYNYPFISQDVYAISKDKLRSYAFAQSHGVRTPSTLQTTSIEAAKQFLARYKRIIVKPVDGFGGKGLTVDVTGDLELQRAIDAAIFGSKEPLLQEQFIGEEIRLTVLDGQVRSVILRQTPRVVGDGTKSIAELIEAENEERCNFQLPFNSYPPLSRSIVPDHFIHDDYIPKSNEIIELSRATMLRHGASFYGVTSRTHSSYIKIAEQLASRMDTAMLVVDLMVKDLTKPANDDNYIFLEFNTAPHLETYSLIRSGDQPDIIRIIADMIDAYSISQG